jgi:hypothetical protein
MAKAWKDVIASPQYQQLPPEQQAAAQDQYFNEVVAPQAGDQADAARQQFFAAYPPVVSAQSQESVVGSGQQQSQQAQSQQDGGVLSFLGNMISGADRETEQSRNFDEVRNSAFVKSGGAKLNWIMDHGSEQQQIKALQDAGAAMSTDDKGNVVVSVPHRQEKMGWLASKLSDQLSPEIQGMGGEVGKDAEGNSVINYPAQQFILNKPGVSGQDLKQFANDAVLYAPASAVGALGRGIAATAGTEAARQVANYQASGEGSLGEGALNTALAVGIDAATRGIGRIAGTAYRARTGNIAPEQAALIQTAEQRGVPLMTSDIMEPTTWYGNALRSTGEKIPFAGTGGPRAEQQAARVRSSEAFAEEYGVNRTFNPRDQEIFDSLVASRNETKRQAGRVYGEINRQMGDTPIPFTGTLQAIDSQIAQLSRSPNANQGTIRALNQFREDLTTGPKNLQAARDDRSNFRELMVGENKGNALTTRQDAVNRRIYSALTSDIRGAVGRTAGAGAVSRLTGIDRVYALEANAIKKSKLKNIFEKGDVSPDLVNGALFSNKLSDVRGLYNQLTDTGRANGRTALISRAYNKALKDGDISVERFNNELQKLRPQTEVFFTGRDRAQLEGFKRLMSETRQAARAPVTTPTGMTATQMGSTAGAAAGMFVDPVSTILVATGAGGVGAGARIYESVAVRNALLRLANTPRGSTLFEQRVNEARRVINAAGQAGKD